jgi:hypothetical protein
MIETPPLRIVGKVWSLRRLLAMMLLCGYVRATE